MRKDSWACSAAAGIGAAFGLFARWLQQINIFEEGTGLATPGALSSRMYVLVCVLAAAVLAYLLLRVRRRMAPPPEQLELLSSGRLFPILMGISGVLAAAGSVLIFFLGKHDALSAILAVLGLLAALGIGLYPLALRYAEQGCVLCTAPILFSCFWFILLYKDNISDPVLWHYAPVMVTVAAAILAWFYMAGFAFCQPRPLVSAFSSYYAAILCVTILPDGRPVGETLILISFALSLAVLAWHTLYSLSEQQ